MASFERDVDGSSRQHVVYTHSQTSGFVYSAPTLPNSAIKSEQKSLHIIAAPNSAVYTGPDDSHGFFEELLEHAENLQSSASPIDSLDSLEQILESGEYFFQEPNGDGIPENCIEEDLLHYYSDSELEPPSSFDSAQLSNSTYSSGPAAVSSLENVLERSCCASGVEKELSDMFEAASSAKADRKRKRGAEVHISNKIPRDGTYRKRKVWLGAFATSDQANRARDVGKYFLCTKTEKKFSDPRSKEILSTYEDRLRELPLAVVVKSVIKVAKQYGEHGTLPESVEGL